MAGARQKGKLSFSLNECGNLSVFFPCHWGPSHVIRIAKDLVSFAIGCNLFHLWRTF